MKTHYQAIIIGSGPSGIGAAFSLLKAGISDILVLERESEIGGVPRHCRHPSFGITAHFYPMSGPAYLQKILAPLPQTIFKAQASVTRILKEGQIEVSTPEGIFQLSADRVILAMGARETPRHPRLVSGLRPQGVFTTGALQQSLYLNPKKPFAYRAPVIVGTELVSFSALWSLRAAGITPKAMLEASYRPCVWKICTALPRLLGVPVHCHTKIVDMGDKEVMRFIEVKNTENGYQKRIACDSVIFTGQFVGESTLIRHSHLTMRADTGVPVTDEFGRCSDTVYFATGNVLHPVETGEQCYVEGLAVGRFVAQSLQGDLPFDAHIPIFLEDARLKVVFPSALSMPHKAFGLHLRAAAHFSGVLSVHYGQQEIAKRKICVMSQQGFAIKNLSLPQKYDTADALRVTLS